jgi:hypothetical protein
MDSHLGGAPEAAAQSKEFAERIELVAIDMGYGHLRPAHALSEFVGATVLHADRAPLASTKEQRQWAQVRQSYELHSRATHLPLIGAALREVMDGVTNIPSLYPRRDLSQRTLGVRILEAMAQRGLGSGLAARLTRENRALVTTFYGPAVLSDHHGCERLYCVVTDSDINRVWGPIQPESTNIVYFAPCMRVRRRLKAYGVPADQVIVTGFPLPHGLVGGVNAPILRRDLARRLVALDPRGRFLREVREEVSHFLGELPKVTPAPVHLVFAVGGAGAQVRLAQQFLPSLAKRIRKGRLKVTLVAGIRQEVAQAFREAITLADLGPEHDAGQVAILLAETHEEYFVRFNELLHAADILWTKPSELTFYGALGIPLLFSWPVGSHERHNQRWAIDSGSGIKQYDPRHVGDWLWELLKDGTLAGRAWTGYMRMPKFGLYRIVEEVLGPTYLEERLRAHAAEPDADAGSTPPPSSSCQQSAVPAASA